MKQAEILKNIRIFCVNLERRDDRRREMRERLRGVSLPFEFFKAVDGKKINSKFLKKHKIRLYSHWKNLKSQNPFHRRELKTGEIGCSLSHYFLWQKIFNRGLNCGIILEDDAKLEKAFKTKLLRSLDRLYKKNIQWDLIYLGRTKMSLKEPKVAPGVVVPGFSYTTVGYVVSQQGAQKLISSPFKHNLIPVDEFLPAMYSPHPRRDIRAVFGAGKSLNAYAVTPDLVTQSRSDTDTEASALVEGKVRPASVLRVPDETHISWSKGHIIVGGPISKENSLSIGPGTRGQTLLLLDHFSKPSPLSNFMSESKLKRADALELVSALIELGAVEVIQW